MSGAGERLAAAAAAALRGIERLGVFAAPPLQAAVPWACVEAGPERDWGHKSGVGRELRLAVTIRDRGESGARIARLLGEAEAAVAGLAAVPDWQLVTLVLLRSMTVPPRRGGAEAEWLALAEFRARMLAA